MLLLFGFGFILSYKESACYKAIPGQPIPHAEVLDDIISRHMGNGSYAANTILDFIMADPNTTKDLTYTDDNLEVTQLDLGNLRKIINIAKRKYQTQSGADTRRQAEYRDIYSRNKELHESHPYVIDKVFDMMKQSIYQTRFRINDTIPFRQKYIPYHSYQIAVLYGAATVIVARIESLLGQMKNFDWKTHFLWYVIIYEKIIAGNVDITDIVDKIFAIQEGYKVIRGRKKKKEQMVIDISKYQNLAQGIQNSYKGPGW